MKKFKFLFVALLAVFMAAAFTACDTSSGSGADPDSNGSTVTGDSNNSVGSGNQTPSGSDKEADESKAPDNTANDSDENKTQGAGNDNGEDRENTDEEETKILVVYFSATNNTEGVAQKIQTATDADIYEIIAAVPYTSADLNYNTDCRANREQNDPTARPEINGSVENISQYDTVFIGYPIWWGTLPKIIYTFLDTYDLSGKTLVPFCTSGGSGISTSVNAIKREEPNATVLEGRRFPSGVSQSDVNSWVNGLGL